MANQHLERQLDFPFMEKPGINRFRIKDLLALTTCVGIGLGLGRALGEYLTIFGGVYGASWYFAYFLDPRRDN